MLSCLMKISRRRDCPQGLYLRLNLSKRWKSVLSACLSVRDGWTDGWMIGWVKVRREGWKNMESKRPPHRSALPLLPPHAHQQTLPTPAHQHAHVERVDVEVVARQVERLEDLLEREVFAVAEDDDLIRLLAKLGLDEAQQVLLVHACAVVDVRVDFAHVIEVAVGGGLLRQELLHGTWEGVWRSVCGLWRSESDTRRAAGALRVRCCV
eukprot:365385-Chlamydomonas_euryale.AAC.1